METHGRPFILDDNLNDNEYTPPFEEPQEEEPQGAALLLQAAQACEDKFPALKFFIKAQLLMMTSDGSKCANYALATDYLEQSLAFYREGDCELDISIYIYTLLMDTYHKREMHHRCLSVAREWVSRYPRSVTGHAALCAVLFEQEQYDDCLAACTEAIKLPESEMHMHYYCIRGKCHKQKQQFEMSCKDFEKVKALAGQKDLVRFSEVKEPFLTTDKANRTAFPTAYSENHALHALLMSVVQASKGPSSPDLPDQAKPRARNKSRHFSRSNSIRLLTANLGQM